MPLSKSTGGSTTSKWAFGSGIIACLLISLSSLGFLIWVNYGPQANTTPPSVISEMTLFLIIAAWAGLIAASLFRLPLVWAPLANALRRRHSNNSSTQKMSDEAIIKRGFKEHFLYLAMSLFSLSAIGFLSASDIAPFNSVKVTGDAAVISTLHTALFFGAFLSSFLPLVIGFSLHARTESKSHSQPMIYDNVISRGTLIITSGLTVGLVSLAAAAGKKKLSFGDNFGIYVTLVVIVVFLSFVATPHILRLLNDREARVGDVPVTANGLSAFYPERWASYADSLLVRIVAPITGATQKGVAIPHLLMLALLIPLSALGFILASPYGLLPIGLAMLLILALGRRWAWVETDRETSSRLQSTRMGKTSGIRLGFDNDLKDEALLGYASLFILVPLALFQIDGAITSEDITGRSFEAWLRFFGAELAKAVPFVDWWEIYQVPVGTPAEFATDTSFLLKHLTFAARAMVDLVIMAALLQAIGIWQRTRTQKSLYNEGHVNAFDPFTEQDFFERGMKAGAQKGEFVPKRKFVTTIKTHISKRGELGLLPSPYSARRLGELINSENVEVRAGAKWMIREFSVLAGTPQERLEQLSRQWATLQLPQLAAQRSAESRERIRIEKLRFEQLLLDIKAELADEGAYFKQSHAGLLLGLLEEVQTGPEFSYSRILALELLATSNRSQFTLAAFAAHLYGTSAAEADSAQAIWWKNLITEKFGRMPSVNLRNYDLRRYVYEAIETYASGLACEDRRFNESLHLLDWMTADDRSKKGRALAETIAKRLRTNCS